MLNLEPPLVVDRTEIFLSMSEKLANYIEAKWSQREDKESSRLLIDPDDVEWTPEEVTARKKADPMYSRIWSHITSEGKLPLGFYWDDVGCGRMKFLRYRQPESPKKSRWKLW